MVSAHIHQSTIEVRSVGKKKMCAQCKMSRDVKRRFEALESRLAMTRDELYTMLSYIFTQQREIDELKRRMNWMSSQERKHSKEKKKNGRYHLSN